MQMMVMLALSRFHLDRNRVERAVADPALRDNGLGEGGYRFRRSF